MPRQDKRSARTMMRGQGARATVDTGSGTPRVAQGRAKHASRGQFVNFYEDLGISATPGQAKGIREEEAKFQEKVKEQKGKISGAQSQYKQAQSRLSSAKGEIPGVSEAANKAWRIAERDFVPIRVVDSSGNNIEATYRLPRDVADNLASSGDFVTAWKDDGRYFNVSVRTRSGAIRGQELHTALGNARTDVKTSIRSQAADELAPVIKERRRDVAEAEAMLSQQGQTISQAESQLRTVEAKRAKQWEKLHSDYENKLETMRKIFEDLEVKGGEKKTTAAE